MRSCKRTGSLVLKSKELRFKSFSKIHKIKADSDKFDDFCEHLVVIDTSIADDFVVGTIDFI